jgi:glutathione synthase/RimK-type ligase-like ATP-grasp enzyme
MKVALVSCSSLPGWEVDDQPLIKAFVDRGCAVSNPAWDDEVDWSAFDICLLRTTWDYTLYIEKFLAWVEQVSEKTMLWNDHKIIKWNSDKRYLRDLQEKGVPIAPTVWLEEEQDIASILQDKNWDRAFLKPIVGACANDTLRFTIEESSVAQQLLSGVLKNCGMMLQPYLSRVETEGEYSAIYFAGKLSHCVQKIPVVGDYRVQDDFGAFDKRIEALPGLIELAQKSLDAIEEDWLYARVDALQMEDDTWVLNELEMIEPSLFFRHSKTAASTLVEATLSKTKIRAR